MPPISKTGRIILPIVFTLTSAAQEATPITVPYQGSLSDAGSEVNTVTRPVTFRLYAEVDELSTDRVP